MPEPVYLAMEEATRALFERGTVLAARNSLILVDTKYEFGDVDGELVVIDELHTPDSSRFWEAASYERRFQSGDEPESYDKEFLRRWYVERGYRGEGVPPEMPVELALQMSALYVDAYERLTGEAFVPASEQEDPEARIRRNLVAAGIL